MKTLELIFLNEMGRQAKLVVDEPREDVTEAEITSAMDAIIASGVFTTNGGNYVTKHSAKVIERTETVFEMAE
ncbi:MULTISPECIES: DUF2922 domain-containing protein [Sutcliffiella]|uniref:DUF2922 domain-containing protein n=1 Tax=Sutcliffiella cohnii TaxID=33932 RepID=A0A223KY41_9BACI|nr:MULTISPECIES: DUF2922 domain-containing protein [Sutcliffiella]AST94436.1 hypothetical protein BC6307_20140 [Sutcliffiella cohnii]MED4014514.1 DUF2922 domain-containing protein [Sutcliffiella cohnii]WBL17685.1 DUF2922 domain-containing protein [Sutcliffiella sp. NC1]